MKYYVRFLWVIFLLLWSNHALKSLSTGFQAQSVYKIQVASFLSEYPAADIQKELDLQIPLSIHYINGRYKYCVGEYATFEEAAADLPNVPVSGAYVVRIPQSQVKAKPVTAQTTEVNAEQQAVSQQTIKTQKVTDTIYVIQIAASKVFIQPDNIRRKVGVANQVKYFTRDGWYKYYFGRFNSSDEAASKLSQLVVKGFVTYITETREVAVATQPEKATGEIATKTLQTQQKPSDTTGVARQEQRAYPLSKTGIQELYSLKIHDADSLFNLDQLLVARKLYREALVLSPEKNYPKEQIKEIDSRLKTQKSRPLFSRIPTITYIILVIILIMIVVLIITLILRTRRQRRERHDQVLRQEYQDSVTEYLFDEKAGKPANLQQADSSQKKQILIDEIMQLYANLSGEISNRLRELYMELGLDNESVKKTKSPQWHVKAKGFRELAQMNIKTVNEEIERCLNSSNDVLRMEAQLAMVRLNYEDPFSFLDKLEKPFTSWEQLHVYEMIQRYQIPVPDFTRWFNTGNITVLIFCIRMIRAFKQSQAYERLLPLLTHANDEIREEAIITLGELRNDAALPIFRERYVHESEKNKVLILQSMSKIPDESNIEFLRSVLEPSNKLRIEAADALARIESFGVRGIETILKRSDEDLQAVARHILDSKIHRR
ncbi:MAG: HEAT repeat domain-containing protein [Bacteroidales bacterium]|nr:HEAT repeat domain-containing protein [Bacteroidales bacterium]